MPLPPLVVTGQVIAASHINAIRNYLPLMADGSAATPGFRFESDPDTGLYRSASDTLAIVSGGAARVTVSNSVVTMAVPVDVATISPSAPVGLWTAGAHNFQATFNNASASATKKAGCNFSIDGSDLWQLCADNADGNKFKVRQNNTTDRITVDQAGNVGIGTNVPHGMLHLAGANTSGAQPITGLLLDRVFDTVGDSMDIVWGSGSGMTGNKAARLAVSAVAGGEAGFIFYAQTGAGEGYSNEIFRIQGNGTHKLFIGGSLKTLSVDGSGFVKAT